MLAMVILFTPLVVAFALWEWFFAKRWLNKHAEWDATIAEIRAREKGPPKT